MANEQFDVVSEFRAAFKQCMDLAAAHAPTEEEETPVFLQRLRELFGAGSASLPILAEEFRAADHPNVHLALHAYVHADGPRRSCSASPSPMAALLHARKQVTFSCSRSCRRSSSS